MLVLLSPSKTMEFAGDGVSETTKPRFHREANQLAAQLKKLTKKQLQQLMGVSDQLADQVHSYYSDWRPTYSASPAQPAVLAYRGDVYNGLEAWQLSQRELKKSTNSLRILSGLYGLLRPLDLIHPYRLEMGADLNVEGQRLADYWSARVTRQLKKDLRETGSSAVINLASKEYSQAVDFASLGVRIVTPIFKDKRNGVYRFITLFGKQARGKMARHIVRENPQSLEELAQSDIDGYRFNQELSKGDNWTFTRD